MIHVPRYAARVKRADGPVRGRAGEARCSAVRLTLAMPEMAVSAIYILRGMAVVHTPGTESFAGDGCQVHVAVVRDGAWLMSPRL